LVFFPFALALAFTLHFAFQERLGCPASGFGLLLGGNATTVLGVDFGSRRIVLNTVSGRDLSCRGRVGVEVAIHAVGITVGGVDSRIWEGTRSWGEFSDRRC
jgi:hypothetical protein